MPQYHHFDFDSNQTFRWTSVQPGDFVVSPGAIAYRARDFADRNDDTKVLHLRRGLLFVLARIPGVPGESELDDVTTFVVLSRHGIILLLQQPETR